MKAKIFSIDGRVDFVNEIIKSYNSEQPIPYPEDFLKLGEVKVQKFSDNELSVNFQETIRGMKVFLVCSTNSSDSILKLMLAVDAAKRSSAEEIITIIPYYGYARQDRKDGMRGSIGARVFADMLQSVGVNRVITMDLHAEQIQGFFSVPVDHVSGKYIFSPVIEEIEKNDGNVILCSPDAGGMKRVESIQKKLMQRNPGWQIGLSMLSKRRDKPNSIESMDLIGDVKGKNVIIVDDMVDTAGTLCKAAEVLMEAGASSVRAICTHGVLSGPAYQRLEKSQLKELIISDSLEHLFPGINGNTHLPSYIRIVQCSSAIARIAKAIVNKVSANTMEEEKV